MELRPALGFVAGAIVYKASADGFNGKEFHAKCAGISPTLTLFKIIDGDWIGGYTEKTWDAIPPHYLYNKDFPYGPKGSYKADSQACLFNVSQGRHFSTGRPTAAITCNGEGPIFGFDELKLSENFREIISDCYQHQSFHIETTGNGTINMLTNKKISSSLMISEILVFKKHEE